MLKIEQEARRIAALLTSASPTEKALIYKKTVDSCRMELTDTENGLVRDSYVLGRLAQHLDLSAPLKAVVDEVAYAAVNGQLTVGLGTWRAIAELATEHAKSAKKAA